MRGMVCDIGMLWGTKYGDAGENDNDDTAITCGVIVMNVTCVIVPRRKLGENANRGSRGQDVVRGEACEVQSRKNNGVMSCVIIVRRRGVNARCVVVRACVDVCVLSSRTIGWWPLEEARYAVRVNVDMTSMS